MVERGGLVVGEERDVSGKRGWGSTAGRGAVLQRPFSGYPRGGNAAQTAQQEPWDPGYWQLSGMGLCGVADSILQVALASSGLLVNSGATRG